MKKTPVTVWGIEFDALIEEQKTLAATIPVYPVEEGFPVSDTIINEPVSVQMTLYVSNTPVTWLYRHGTSADRVTRVCDQIEQQWLEKKLTKIVTSDTIYTDMGITSIAIKRSREIGYAREITLTARKVRITERRTVTIPDHILKSGETMANAGKAATSSISGRSRGKGSSSMSKNSSSGGSSTGSGGSQAGRAHSALYGVASGLGLI